MCDYQEERKCIGPIGRIFGHRMVDGFGQSDTYCARCGWIISRPVKGAADIIAFYQDIIKELNEQVLYEMRRNSKSGQLEAHPNQETPYHSSQRRLYRRTAT